MYFQNNQATQILPVDAKSPAGARSPAGADHAMDIILFDSQNLPPNRYTDNVYGGEYKIQALIRIEIKNNQSKPLPIGHSGD